MLVAMDKAALQITDNDGSLPIHLLCKSGTTPTDDASVRYLVEQGGVRTLKIRNHEGALPLHVLCGSTDPPLRTVQYLIQSSPGTVTAQTNAGHYPFMIAAFNESPASLSVFYELIRADPNLFVQSAKYQTNTPACYRLWSKVVSALWPHGIIIPLLYCIIWFLPPIRH